MFRAAEAAGALYPAISMSALCFAIVQVLPLVTKAVPSSLIGLAIASGVGTALKLPLATLSSSASEGTFTGGLSALPRIVDLGQLKSMAMTPSTVKLVLPAAISIALIALVETLLAGKVVDDMIGDDRTIQEAKNDDVPTRSVIAMSIGNIISSLLGGFGGCGLIPQTVLNLKSGGKGHFSSISYALAMASFVLVFAPFVGQISQSALSGIMICVALDTVAWESSLRTIMSAINLEYHRDESKAIMSRAQRLIDVLALSISTIVCSSGKLAVGIIAGVLVQCGLLSACRRLGFGTKV